MLREKRSFPNNHLVIEIANLNVVMLQKIKKSKNQFFLFGSHWLW